MNNLTDRHAIIEMLAAELGRAPTMSEAPPLPPVDLAEFRNTTDDTRSRRRPLALGIVAAAFIASVIVGARFLQPSTYSVVAVVPTTPTEDAERTTNSTPTALIDVSPSTSVDVTNAPVDPTAVIPPPEGPNDTRGPFARFFGVPADPAKAGLWDARLEQNGIKLCFEAHGFKYQIESVDTGDPSPNEANMRYLDSLSAPEQAEYRTLLGIGDGGYDASCERKASDRVYYFNARQAEFDSYMDQYNADPRIVTARAAITACVQAHGEDPSRPAASQAGCEAEQNWTAVGTSVENEIETAFILDHLGELQEFLVNRAPLEQ